MEETKQTWNNKLEDLVAQLQEMKKKVKADIKKLSILYIFENMMPTSSTKHLDATMDRVNKSTVAGNALLDCYNSLKGLTLESKIFVLEILINKLFSPTEAEVLTSLINLDNHCKMLELAETDVVKTNKPVGGDTNERVENIKKFREFINAVLQLRFNEEEK